MAAERPAAWFLASAYALSWCVWGIGWVIASGEASFVPFVIAGGFGPAVAAVATVWLGGGSVRPWLRSAFSWRVAPRWYLAALLVPVAMYAVAAAALVGLGPRFGRTASVPG